MKRNRTYFSWQLKLILVLGCLGGLAATLFGRYVDSISDLPLGATPLSWTFKKNSANVSSTFSEENAVMQKKLSDGSILPEIDLVAPAETEYALFALG